MQIHVALIAENAAVQQRFEKLLTGLGAVVESSVSEPESLPDVTSSPLDLVVVSHSVLASPVEDTVPRLLNHDERPDVVVVWQGERPQERARLLAAGCTAVLNEVVDDSTLSDLLTTLLERIRAEVQSQVETQAIEQFDETQPHLDDFHSKSPRMESFMRIVRRVVEPSSSLLILGETGVGKERLARAIHAGSPRADKPFVPVILSAFPESLLEGELFGYEKGAFTGAESAKRGFFELAHGGTIFLDEIGELPLHTQVKLLGVLQERTIQRLGSEQRIKVDVRVMAATNRDLREATTAGRFRNDLYYRLSVVTLDVPPLRRHPEDVVQLVDRYLDEFRIKLGRRVTGVSPDAMQALTTYSWPGNIRELINVIERAVLLCEGSEVTPADLPFDVVHRVPVESGGESDINGVEVQLSDEWIERPWKPVREAALAKTEVTYLQEHLEETGGNLSEVAERAGLNPRTLYDMMQRHGLRKESFRFRRDSR